MFLISAFLLGIVAGTVLVLGFRRLQKSELFEVFWMPFRSPLRWKHAISPEKPQSASNPNECVGMQAIAGGK